MTTGIIPSLVTYFRGQSLRFHVNFTDFDGNPVNPPQANLVLFYTSVTLDDQTLTIALSPPAAGLFTWTAIVDTRNFAAGHKVQWTINTPTNLVPPVPVLDGAFLLSGNQANQPTF